MSLTTTDSMTQLRSSSQALRNVFQQGIICKHIAEKLQTCQVDDDGTDVRQRMKQLDFDVLGVEENGVVHGYVEQSKLGSASCRIYQRTFHPSELISESTPLTDLLPILSDTPWVFVLDRNRVNGIVTRGDLQKAPVRMLMFALVTLLEMHLLRVVRTYYPENSWQKLLKRERLKSAKQLLAERQARNQAIDLADCLQFCDKRELVLKNLEILRRISPQSKKSVEHFLRATEDLRNRLAHGQDLVAGSSWPVVIDLVKRIEDTIKRCEDEDIERNAQTTARRMTSDCSLHEAHPK